MRAPTSQITTQNPYRIFWVKPYFCLSYALLNDANVDARHPEVANDGLNILETGVPRACSFLLFVLETSFRFVFKTFVVELRHRLLLRDSHAALLRDPSFVTNKTDAFQGVIDYIW